MTTDYRGRILTSVAIDPQHWQRIDRLRKSKGFPLRAMIDEGLSWILDKLEGLPPRQVKEPQRFKRAGGGTGERRVVSPFAAVVSSQDRGSTVAVETGGGRHGGPVQAG